MHEPSELTAATAEESVDPKSGSTLFVGAVGVLTTVVIVLALQVLYYQTTERERFRKAVLRESEELHRVREEQGLQLETYRWVDPDRSVVAIPIERAMELVVEEHGAAR